MYSPFKYYTTGSQILTIALTLKALDFLLKKSVVFYTHKKTKKGRAWRLLEAKNTPLRPKMAWRS